MIWALSFLFIIMSAKIGDDYLDMRQSFQYDELNQQQEYVDLYGCSQKYGNYDYQ